MIRAIIIYASLMLPIVLAMTVGMYVGFDGPMWPLVLATPVLATMAMFVTLNVYFYIRLNSNNLEFTKTEQSLAIKICAVEVAKYELERERKQGSDAATQETKTF